MKEPLAIPSVSESLGGRFDEHDSAGDWIRQRARLLIDDGMARPTAFQRARAEYAQLLIREGTTTRKSDGA